MRWQGATTILVAAVAAGVLLGCSEGADDGPTEQSSLSIPDARAAGIGIRRQAARGTAVFDDLSAPASPLYRVWRTIPSQRLVQLRFSLPEDLAEAEDRLYVATRESAHEMWFLRSGRRRGSHLIVTTQALSQWQLRLFGHRLQLPSLGPALGVRAKDPHCPATADGLRVEVAGQEASDPLVYACPERHGSGWAMTIYNNRAVGLEFEVPSGVRILATKGRSLTESAWEAVNLGLPSGTWRLVPGGGSVKLGLDQPPARLSFRTTSSSLLFEVMLGAVGKMGGKIAKAARFVSYAECAHAIASGARSLTDLADLVAAAREIWARCGKLLGGLPIAAVGAAVMGGAGIAVGIHDGIADLGKTATVEFMTTKPALLPEVRPVPGLYSIEFAKDQPARVGRFDIAGGAATVGDAIDAFGPPDERLEREGACELRWGGMELTAITVDFGSSRPCAPATGRVQQFVIESDAFKTEAGLKVGMSEQELLRLYPRASTRTGDVYVGLDRARGTLYTLAGYPAPFGGGGGILATLQAEVLQGRVRVIEVAPWLGGE